MSQQLTVTINKRGIFTTTTRTLSPRGIIQRRARLQNKILETKEQLSRWQSELQRLQQEQTEINQPVVNEYLKHAEEQKRQSQKRAEVLLRDYLGENNYRYLMRKGRLSFKAKDGLTYRVNRKGHVFRGGKRLCIIRPTNLPLPDFVIAALVNVKTNPRKYRFQR